MKTETSANLPGSTLVNLIGVKVTYVALNELLERIVVYARNNVKIVAAYVNIHAMNIAYTNSRFRDFLNQCQIVFCDGHGVGLAAWLTGQTIAARFTPPDFIDRICETAKMLEWRIFFLGGKPGVAQCAAEKLMGKYPGLKIVTYHGYFDKINGGAENRTVIAYINQIQPQILFVGFGMPLQESWIQENIEDLQINIAFPVGAMFDYISGETKRAPRWMTDRGFEWLGRLLIEPRRLWKRYLIGNPIFFWRLFIHHFLRLPLPGQRNA